MGIPLLSQFLNVVFTAPGPLVRTLPEQKKLNKISPSKMGEGFSANDCTFPVIFFPSAKSGSKRKRKRRGINRQRAEY
jgi:hypothetical protein